MNLSQLTEYDTFLFHQGTNCKAYEMLGAHIVVGRYGLWVVVDHH